MKTVMITGASSGLGLALAHYYAQNSYKVIACGRNKEKLSELTEKYDNIETLIFDITQAEQVNNAAIRCHNTIDILILNAGDCEYIDEVKNFNSELFERVIKVNLIAAGYLIAAFANQVSRGGQLVFVSSMVTTMPFPKAHAYGASKAGINYLANTLRFDLKAENIDVTIVQPGFIKTPLTDKNDFSMPFLLTSADAAKRIYQGIKQRSKTVIFPKRFYYLLMFMRLLPDFLWHKMFFKGGY